MNLRLIFCFAILTLVVSGCERRVKHGQQTVLVFAAASSIDAVEEISQQFERENQTNVQASFASSSTLAIQMLNGAQPDLFLSANLDWIAKLESRELVYEFKNGPENQLVVIASHSSKQDGRFEDITDLLDERFERIAIADPDSVPAGSYTKKALLKAGIWDKLKDRMVYGANVRQTLAQVESGAIGVGVVYLSDALHSKSTEIVFAIDRKMSGPIEYGMILTKHGHQNQSAVKLYQFFSSESSMRVFKKHGFAVRGNND